MALTSRFALVLIIAMTFAVSTIAAQQLDALRAGVRPAPARLEPEPTSRPDLLQVDRSGSVAGSYWKEGGFLAVAIVFVAAYQTLPYRREPGKRMVISLFAASLAFLPGAIVGSWFPKRAAIARARSARSNRDAGDCHCEGT